MKATLAIEEGVMRRLQQEAARRRCTVSELVETAVRVFLENVEKPQPKASPLPCIDAGAPYVDLGNRDALYDALEER